MISLVIAVSGLSQLAVWRCNAGGLQRRRDPFLGLCASVPYLCHQKTLGCDIDIIPPQPASRSRPQEGPAPLQALYSQTLRRSQNTTRPLLQLTQKSASLCPNQLPNKRQYLPQWPTPQEARK